ncbi:DNA helicase RecQ [Owenweeksia hongkongensis]|uniref:DNA helicase RecQ n=1 Tax=Owenweeksia hongkongensis (strain DSM 17368 / CIP 108786 / JCM 12287 / NRRL B-23963 / UST20020801) TaxID=926562 RepID=G8R5M9_OWEHD|nr:DNA helicase RecQ [Owenweeksia hongkongensis]AEV34345.1 ATP-dependent DNA helicase RecQ [Owenweeksia hongkongensis DSM 17368]
MKIATVHDELKKYFGFDQFKGNQEAVINNVIAGNDTFVIMPTGGGKSMCYQLPALMQSGTAIVVSPLIALMKNQVDSIRGFSEEHGVAHVLNSSLTKGQTEQVKEDIRNGITKLLYVAPESLTKEENIEFLQGCDISFYAIDEAHCISEWGHDFRPEYRNLKNIITAIGRKPVIALTATATPKVQGDIQKNLGMDDAQVFKASFNRPNLYYEVRPKTEHVDRDIIKFIKGHMGKSGIIYCLSRKKVEELAETLQVNGINALPYHAGLDAKSRVRHQDAFLMEEADVIVATIAFGMGIDKPDVRFVMHYDMPKSLESYYQETGRAGRDGGEGICIAFYAYKDIEKLEKFLHGKPVSEQEVGMQLLQEVVAFAETSMNRRKFILHYFGEEFDEENGPGAKNDDNSQHPKKQFEAKDDIKLVLETIAATNERFKALPIVNILIGNKTTMVKQHKSDQLDQFMKGADHDDKYWMSVIRQAVVTGLLKKDIEKYGVLNLTEAGKDFIKNPKSFMMSEDHNYESTEGDDDIITAGKAGGAAFDETLYGMLKDLTRKVAKEKEVPPYAVFQEPSLNEMAMNYPTTLDELKNISGVGEGKAKKFGKPFVALIQKYVEDNNIDKPDDFVVKSVVNKSGLKVYIIQSTDRKLPLEDIAASKGITMEDLVCEIENIVNSGTKVNIDYYIESLLDEEQIEEITEYFLESDSDDLKDAHEEFDGDYDEDELRLMRIKFMSDVAN